MPIELKCERCGSLMASLTYERLRDYIQTHGEVCSDCQKKEKKLESFYEKQKGIYIRKLDKLLEDAKSDLAKQVGKIANVADGD